MPWAPGQSGNPGGRPKTKIVSDLIRERLALIPEGDERSDAKKLADVIVDGAISGDIAFIKELLNRVEGKVADNVVVTETSESPKRLVIKKRDDRRRNAGGGEASPGD